MEELLNAVIDSFRGEDLTEVYSSFDAVPLPRKSDRLFTVIAMERVNLELPFPDGKRGVIPFRAIFKVSVLVPMTSPLRRAEDFFYRTALPRMEQMGAVCGEVVPPVVDVKLGRIIMSGCFTLKGMLLEDAEVSA